MIPLKIETLIERQVVERNRVEYNEGWNPSDIIHTIYAFANDYAYVNGGYLVESMSELEKGRVKIVLAYLKKDSINSAIAASILDVQIKTASRLLKQAEEIGLLKSEGRTRDKIYKIK